MVFGFFSRKAPQASESPSKLPVQLRTPSPSVDGQFLHPNASPSLGPPATPSPTPDAVQTTFNPPIADATELQSFISSIPPKTFHEYTVSHLTEEPPSQEIIDALSSFFSQLTRPPQLHCVRCHKSYFDVENGDRSCLVAHDDDSATVERVSGAYETLYGCCEKTVEGDGDMGPPDGYCYEGKHTTDIKRARFRADSSIHDDKLTSCAMMRCFDPPPSPPSDSEGSVASKRKIRRRPRRSVKAADNDDARSTTSSKGKRKRPITDEGDVPDVPAIPATPKSTRMRPPGAQEEEESTDEEEATVVNDADMPSISSAVKAKSKPAPKPRKKRAKTTIDDMPFRPSMGSDADDMDVDDAASSASKPRRKPTVSRKKATRPLQTPSPAPPSSASKSRIPFLTSEASASPILKPSRSSHSPTRSVAGARHGRNVSFSSRTQSVEVVVERQPKPKPLGEVVATSISGEE